MRLSRAALDHLESVVRQHGIDCDWSRAGKYQAAVSAHGEAEVLAPFVDMLKMLDEPHRILNRAETARDRILLLSRIGLHAGLRIDESGGIDARACRYFAR